MLSNNLSRIIFNINRFKIVNNSKSFYCTTTTTTTTTTTNKKLGSVRTHQESNSIKKECLDLIQRGYLKDTKKCLDKVLENVSEQDNIIFGSVIRLASKNGHYQFMKEVISDLLKSGIKISPDTRFDLIKGFIRIGESEKAKESIDLLFKTSYVHKRQVEILIHSASYSNNLEIAELLLKKRQDRRGKLKNSTLLDLICLYVKNNDPEKAKMYLSQLDRTMLMDLGQVEQLIDIVSRFNQIEIMESLIEIVPIDSNIKLLKLVCCAYLRTNDLQKAKKCLDLIAIGYRYFDERSLLTIFETAAKANHYEFIDQVIEALNNVGEGINLNSLKGLLIILYYKGDLENFKKYLDIAKDKDNKAAVVKIFPNLVADKILSFNQSNSTSIQN